MPGGALHADRARAPSTTSTGSSRLHCDPTLDVGQVGLREGPITGAADRARGPARAAPAATPRRPHLTEDLTFALGQGRSPSCPRSCRRRLDPRAGVSVVWGIVHAGSAPQRHPRDRPGRRHGPDARRRRLGRGREAGPRCSSTQIVGAVRRARRRSTTSAACRRWSTSRSRTGSWPARCERVLGDDGQVPTPQSLGRRGLRLVPRPGPRRDGPARHADAGRADVRPAPGQPARRRARGRHRRPGARRVAVALTAFLTTWSDACDEWPGRPASTR